MKKVLVLLFLIIGVSPLVISACTLVPTDSGIMLTVENCENQLYFDLIIEEETTDAVIRLDESNLRYQWDIEQDEEIDFARMDHFDINNDFVSFLGYDHQSENMFQYGCGFHALDYRVNEYGESDYRLEKFKIVVFDENYEVIFTSGLYETFILPGNGDVYHSFIYNQESNTMTTELNDMYIVDLDGCRYMDYMYFLGFLFYFMVVVMIVHLVMQTKKYIESKMSKKFILFANAVDVVSIGILSYTFFTSLLLMFIWGMLSIVLQVMKYILSRTVSNREEYKYLDLETINLILFRLIVLQLAIITIAIFLN